MNKQKILLVDDEPNNLQLLRQILKNDYELIFCKTGEDALSIATEQQPDLVLLDVAMPGLSGYEVCCMMRNDAAFADLPIIFLSSLISDEERLAGYEAGGDDYLTKPVAAGELRFKIDLALKRANERSSLKGDLANTFATAMTAMSSAAEVGVILQFLRSSFNCPDYATLIREVHNTLVSFEMNACVQVRGAHGVMSLGPNGPCSPLEISVLGHMAGHGRLFEFSSCLSCSYEHITIVVRNMDRSDPDRMGRMRDNLALLTEGCEVRIAALDNTMALTDRHNKLIRLVESTKKALGDIDQRHRLQRVASSDIFQDLQTNFERRLPTLGLTETQEDELALMIREASERELALYDAGLSTEVYMENILKQLESTGD